MGFRTRIQGCCDTLRGETRQEYLTLTFFLYSNQTIASYSTHYSTGEPIVTGSLGTNSSTRKFTQASTSRLASGQYHSPKGSHWTRKNSAETSRSRTSSPVRSSPVRYHPCAHFLTVSPHLVAMLVKSPSSPSIPSDFTPRCHSILSRDPSLRARRKHTEQRRRRSGTVVPVRHVVRIYATFLHRTIPQRTYPFDVLPCQFYLQAQLPGIPNVEAFHRRDFA